jgi:hypothetical protein
MTPIARMLAIIVVLFGTMKIAVLAASRTRLPLTRKLAFFFWPGMRPSTFAARRPDVNDVRPPLLRGIRNVVAGAVLVLAARAVAPRTLVVAIVLALPGISLMLHFGLFALATAFWRRAGFDAEDLFRQPLRSRSLAEFWSRRWNVGYSDMIAVTVQRPVAARFGRRAAVAAAFLASGVLHELAISVPAAGGYGLPSIYFALHGALVAAGIRGRAVTIAALVAPLPLLFHPPFLRAIIIPLLLR